MLQKLLLDPMSRLIERVSDRLIVLGMLGLVQAGVYILLVNSMTELEEVYGAKSPDTLFGFTEDDLYTSVLDVWGLKGCQHYMNQTALFDFLFIPLYVIMLSALQWRFVSRLSWDTGFVPQLALAMAIADYGETIIYYTACRQYPIHLNASLLMWGDLCSKIKMVSIACAGLMVFTAAVVKSYLWPMFMLSGPKHPIRTNKTKD